MAWNWVSPVSVVPCPTKPLRRPSFMSRAIESLSEIAREAAGAGASVLYRYGVSAGLSLLMSFVSGSSDRFPLPILIIILLPRFYLWNSLVRWKCREELFRRPPGVGECVPQFCHADRYFLTSNNRSGLRACLVVYLT